MLKSFETDYQYLIASLGLGMLIGLQRESAETSFAGIRTFSLISLYGTVSSILSPKIVPFSMLCLLGIIFIKNQTITMRDDHNMMVTDLTILMTFLVGVMIHSGSILMATSLAVIMALTLQLKKELHHLVARLSQKELKSVFQFLTLSLVIFPILPKKSIPHFEFIQAQQIWLMVIMITGIGLLGHLLTKFIGEKNQIISNGLLGGLISSTATTWNYAKNVQKSDSPALNESIIILISWSTLYLRVFVELLIISPKLNFNSSFLLLQAQSLLGIFWLWTKRKNHKEIKKINYDSTKLKTALLFALFYSSSVYVFSEIKESLSDAPKNLIAFISGIADVDAITLSLGHLHQKKILTPEKTNHYLYLGLLANTLFKGLIAFIITRKKMFETLFGPWLLTIVVLISLIVLNKVN